MALILAASVTLNTAPRPMIALGSCKNLNCNNNKCCIRILYLWGDGVKRIDGKRSLPVVQNGSVIVDRIVR
jgi:hypothetical protein